MAHADGNKSCLVAAMDHQSEDHLQLKQCKGITVRIDLSFSESVANCYGDRHERAFIAIYPLPHSCPRYVLSDP